MAKKKTEGGTRPPTRYGTLIRVSDSLANAIRLAASQEDLTMVDFANRYLLPVAEKRYKENILREAKRLESGAK